MGGRLYSLRKQPAAWWATPPSPHPPPHLWFEYGRTAKTLGRVNSVGPLRPDGVGDLDTDCMRGYVWIHVKKVQMRDIKEVGQLGTQAQG